MKYCWRRLWEILYTVIRFVPYIAYIPYIYIDLQKGVSKTQKGNITKLTVIQVLKRFNVEWKKMEKEIKALDSEKTARNLNRVKRRYGGLPGEEDLQGAARALNRLQTVYR